MRVLEIPGPREEVHLVWPFTERTIGAQPWPLWAMPQGSLWQGHISFLRASAVLYPCPAINHRFLSIMI